MTEEQIALASRAVACKGWRWMPGMATVRGSRIYEIVSGDDGCHGDVECHEWATDDDWGVNRCDYHNGRPLAEASCGHVWLDVVLPDLSDPATLGCLLALVREAWGEPTMSAHFYDAEEWWEVLGYRRAPGKPAGTEAEALVAALEAAP